MEQGYSPEQSGRSTIESFLESSVLRNFRARPARVQSVVLVEKKTRPGEFKREMATVEQPATQAEEVIWLILKQVHGYDNEQLEAQEMLRIALEMTEEDSADHAEVEPLSPLGEEYLRLMLYFREAMQEFYGMLAHDYEPALEEMTRKLVQILPLIAPEEPLSEEQELREAS